MKAIVVTGAREALLRDWHDAVYPIVIVADVVIHGACGCDAADGEPSVEKMRGIDRLAHLIRTTEHVSVIPMPAPWAKKGKGAGPFRNMQMANVLMALAGCGYDVGVVAFHDDLWNASAGTLNMVRRAQFAKLPWAVLDRNGTSYGEG